MTLRRYLPTSLLLLSSLLVLSACSSTPMQYRTLIPTQPAAAGVQTKADFQLQIMPVRIPVQVDQPSLVIRESDGRLTILENALWASPPADEFHDALAFELENRLGVRDLAGLPGTADQPVLTVRTDVRRFDSVPGSHTALDVVWNIEFSNGQTHQALTCASLISEPATAELDSLVLAHQRSISKLADEIAGTARQWTRQSTTVCP
ncbi:PqiC family protein [Halopseudomonas pelagia]|uniref:PqiC family protein n=1 Tax=Halopseudomonas pelagia TaxID=553151 RepID=UPI00039A2BFF|nr:PqiC family protein [Halopseudomonas pelagia]